MEPVRTLLESDRKICPKFFTLMKRHGALLAKGRILGIQFDTLFSDDNYMKYARHAIALADKLEAGFRQLLAGGSSATGLPFFDDGTGGPKRAVSQDNGFGIGIPETDIPEQMTRSEASRLLDRWIAVHGRMPRD